MATALRHCRSQYRGRNRVDGPRPPLHDGQVLPSRPASDRNDGSRGPGRPHRGVAGTTLDLAPCGVAGTGAPQMAQRERSPHAVARAGVSFVAYGPALQVAVPMRSRAGARRYGQEAGHLVQLECSAQLDRNFAVIIRQELLHRRERELHQRILQVHAGRSALRAGETLADLRGAKKRVHARARALLHATSRAQRREWRQLDAAARDGLVAACTAEFGAEVERVERGLSPWAPDARALGEGPVSRQAEKYRRLVVATMLAERIGELRARGESGIDRTLSGLEEQRRAMEMRLTAALRQIAVSRELWTAWTTLPPERVRAIMADGRSRFRSEFQRILVGERPVVVLEDLRCTLADALREADRRGVFALAPPERLRALPHDYETPRDLVRMVERLHSRLPPDERFDRIYTVRVDGAIHNTLTHRDEYVPVLPAFMVPHLAGVPPRLGGDPWAAGLADRAA